MTDKIINEKTLEENMKSRRQREREYRLESLLGNRNKFIDDVSDIGLRSKLSYMLSAYMDAGGTKEEYKSKMYTFLDKL